jgi:hypothetical protein
MNANTELRFLRYARSTSRGGRPAPLVRCPFVTTKAGRLPGAAGTAGNPLESDARALARCH